MLSKYENKTIDYLILFFFTGTIYYIYRYTFSLFVLVLVFNVVVCLAILFHL